MTARHVTKLLILLTALVLLIWDVIAVLNREPNDTISAVIAGWSWKWQSVPFGAGVLVGHLFWPSRSKRSSCEVRAEAIALTVVSVAVIGIDVWIIGVVVPLIPLIAGILAGRLLWSQGPKRPASNLRWS